MCRPCNVVSYLRTWESVVQSSQVHKLRDLLSIILGAIETDNKALVQQTVRRMDTQLAVCQCCPLWGVVPSPIVQLRE